MHDTMATLHHDMCHVWKVSEILPVWVSTISIDISSEIQNNTWVVRVFQWNVPHNINRYPNVRPWGREEEWHVDFKSLP